MNLRTLRILLLIGLLLFLAFWLNLNQPESHKNILHSEEGTPSQHTWGNREDSSSAPSESAICSNHSPQSEANANQPESDVIEAFRHWMAQTAFTKTHLNKEDISRGVELAKARRPVIKNLIRNSPELALQQGLELNQYLRLPPAIRAYTEEPFSEVADLVVLPNCGSDDPNHSTSIEIVSKSDSELSYWKAQPYGKQKGYSSETNAIIQGLRIDGVAAVSERCFQPLSAEQWADLSGRLPVANPNPRRSAVSNEPITNAPVAALAGGKILLFKDDVELERAEQVLTRAAQRPGPRSGSSLAFALPASIDEGGPTLDLESIQAASIQAASEWTQSSKTVLCIVVDFEDVPGAPISMTELTSLISNDVSDVIASNSYGDTSIRAYFSPEAVYRMPQPSSYYAPGKNYELFADAVAMSENSGAVVNDYDLVLVYFNNIGMFGNGFRYAGLASLGGPNVWIQGSGEKTMVHEFGHSYGLGHANRFYTSNYTPYDPSTYNPVGSGNEIEYDDIYDQMGRGRFPQGYFNPLFMEFLGWLDSDKITQPVALDATYRLFRFDHADAEVNPTLALRIQKNTSESYMVSFRGNFENTPTISDGLYVQWEHEPVTTGSATRLIDPILIDGGDPLLNDAGYGIQIGDTFTDPTGNIRITPIAQGGTGANQWIDVRVILGDPGNTLPSITIQQVEGDLTARELVTFNSIAYDPDGDSLDITWSIGNGNMWPGGESYSVRFPSAGTFTLTATANDNRGGVATDSIVLNVEDPLLNWSPATGLADYRSPNYGLYHQGLWITQAKSGTYIDVSPNGKDWSKANLPASGSLHRITYGDGRFVGGFSMSGIKLLHSLDGQDWSYCQLPDISEYYRIHGLEYENGLYLATVGSDSILISSDGIEWQIADVTLPSSHTGIYNISSGSGVFVAIPAWGESGLLRSEDGTEWTVPAGSIGQNDEPFRAITYNSASQKFIALTTSKAFTSSDAGVTWVEANLPQDYIAVSSLTSDRYLYAAHASTDTGGAYNTLLLSADGLNWAEQQLPEGFISKALIAGNSRLLQFLEESAFYSVLPSLRLSAPSTSNNLIPNLSISLPDSITARETFIANASISDADSEEVSVLWDFGDETPIQFPNKDVTHTYMSGQNTNVIAYAVDGDGGVTEIRQPASVSDSFSEWDEIPLTAFTMINDLIEADGALIAVGGSYVFHSLDGLTFDQLSLSGNPSLQSVCWADGYFVTVGSIYDEASSSTVGTIWYSSDGAAWNECYRGGKRLYDVAALSGKVTAVGQDGRIITASISNFNTWADANQSTSFDFETIFSDATRYLIPNKNTLLTSADGINWDTQPNLPSQPYQFYSGPMTHIGGTYFVGYGSSVYQTTDLTNWRLSPIEAGFSVNAFGGNEDYLLLSAKKYDAGWIYQEYISYDNGTNWNLLPNSPNRARQGLVVFNNHIYAGDYRKIERSPLLESPIGWDFWLNSYQSAYPNQTFGKDIDGDGDSYSDLMEYALGLDPTKHDNIADFNLRMSEGGMLLVLTRAEKRMDVSYRLESSINLIDWEEKMLTPVTDNDSILSFGLPDSAKQKSFFRISIDRP